MKKILGLTLLSLTLFSCKKDKDETTSPSNSSNYTYVTTTGSYWIYDWYQVDSLGNETALAWKDTIRIVGDTMMGGNTYHIYKGTEMGLQPLVRYERDSSGFIVNGLDGKVLYSYSSGPMQLTNIVDGPWTNSYNIGAKMSVNTAFGVKEAVTTYHELGMVDGTPVNSCGDLTTKFYYQFVSGIGMVGRETETFSQIANCAKKSCRLSSYYIAP